jgi:glycosyltransferase involved in cell wall biosynthesis
VRILALTQVLPLPLDAGPKIRAYYVLRHLAEAGHDVTLVSFVRPGDRDSDVRSLGRLCSAVETVPLSRSRAHDLRDGLRSLASATPFLVLRDQRKAMDERVRQVMARGSFDAVHADQLWMAPYAARCAGIGLKVLDQHNAVFKVPDRLAANQRNPAARALLRREASKLASFERSTFDAFDHVVWVSADDRNAFPPDGAMARARHDIIPIAVDPGQRQPVERSRPFRVTFLGGGHWPPNAEGVRWFAEAIWPRVAPAAPEAVFTVIGKSAPARLGRSDLRSRIEAPGYVPDLRRFLSETAVFVVPLRTGAGMRVKILDAWCWGLPVVTTTVGAEGLRANHGDNVLIGDSDEAFAEHVVRVLRTPSLARQLSASGRATVEAHYDWRTSYRAWDRVYR